LENLLAIELAQQKDVAFVELERKKEEALVPQKEVGMAR